MRSLLPLNSLRAFEAAARHKNFGKAAEELSVTPAAISQHIQKLEEIVGATLFVRTTRSVALTERASQLLPLISEGFETLELAMREMMSVKQKNIVTLTTTPSFASCWLLPRLERFQASHQDITVHVDARAEQVDFARDGIDLAIRQGTGKYAGLDIELLIADRAVVVCHPALLEGKSVLASPDELARFPILHVDWKMQKNSAPTWQRWCEHHNVSGLDLERGMRFSMEELAARAAMAGMGVALVTLAFVKDDLDAGRLVRPLPESYDKPTVFQHYLVSPKHTSERKAVRILKDWLRQEAALFDLKST